MLHVSFVGALLVNYCYLYCHYCCYLGHQLDSEIRKKKKDKMHINYYFIISKGMEGVISILGHFTKMMGDNVSQDKWKMFSRHKLSPKRPAQKKNGCWMTTHF